MSTKTVVPTVVTTPEPKTRETKVTLAEDQDVMIVDSETLPLISKMFASQRDIANESAFARKFVYDAANSHAKQLCRMIVQRWQNVVAKVCLKHRIAPEAAEVKLLVSRAMRELHEDATKAAELLQILK